MCKGVSFCPPFPLFLSFFLPFLSSLFSPLLLSTPLSPLLFSFPSLSHSFFPLISPVPPSSAYSFHFLCSTVPNPPAHPTPSFPKPSFPFSLFISPLLSYPLALHLTLWALPPPLFLFAFPTLLSFFVLFPPSPSLLPISLSSPGLMPPTVPPLRL